MKCIKRGYEVKRVSDKKAKDLVDSGDWSYTNKQAWKQAGRKHG